MSIHDIAPKAVAAVKEHQEKRGQPMPEAIFVDADDGELEFRRDANGNYWCEVEE